MDRTPTIMNFEFVECLVQRPVGPGEDGRAAAGAIGVSMGLAPDGTPRVLCEIVHPDGSIIAAVLGIKQFQEVCALLQAHGAIAYEAQVALDQQKARPS